MRRENENLQSGHCRLFQPHWFCSLSGFFSSKLGTFSTDKLFDNNSTGFHVSCFSWAIAELLARARELTSVILFDSDVVATEFVAHIQKGKVSWHRFPMPPAHAPRQGSTFTAPCSWTVARLHSFEWPKLKCGYCFTLSFISKCNPGSHEESPHPTPKERSKRVRFLFSALHNQSLLSFLCGICAGSG